MSNVVWTNFGPSSPDRKRARGGKLMAEPDFEAQLTRMFAQPPSFPDAALFNAEVAAKLDRGWAMRRMLIAVGGTGAGLVGAFQIFGSRFSSELAQLSREGSQGLETEIQGGWAKLTSLLSTPSSAEAVWLAAGLAVVALAFAVTRVVEDF
ncbi:MAG: hypothetical protein B7Z12_04475 [Caulobacter vibrioides]|uniref:Uncharacterized protein n=1 Tax=Caulobacter vibrioides TaxID=155892 RepID=A0A258DCX1_CAUVI|nr:MAG: hypothetical protein B7Z12_04475 [Caulobacter vibrioides]